MVSVVTKRLLLTLIFCLALIAISRRPADAVDAELGIGSPAPRLDVANWVQDGNGFFKPVTEFEEGKVYVVEFWATWCGPCLQSMPHLAETQEKYRGRDVQIVSITDEPLKLVKTFLEGDSPILDTAESGAGDAKADENAETDDSSKPDAKTYGEVTSAYCLTSDPDGSSHEDYMAASGQQGIPAAFLVGKTGLIEWIGHPMELDGPLEAVVEGTWDREAYKRELELQRELERLQQETMNEVMTMLNAEQNEEAIALLEERIESTEHEQLASRFSDIRHQIKFATGLLDEETLAYYRAQLAAAEGNPLAVAQFSFMINSAIRQGIDPGPLTAEAIAALNAVAPTAEAIHQPTLFVVISQLYSATDKLDLAVAALQRAIDASEGRQKDRLQESLDELKESMSAGPETDKPADADE